MTLTTLNKLRQRDGVTLVELLVVILIVAILAISLIPMFQRYVIKAQYASEAIPLAGHIRTQIGLYQYENGKLPVNSTTADAVFGVAAGIASAPYTVVDRTATGTLGTTATTDKNFITELDLGFSDMLGRRVTPYNVDFAVVTNGNSYGYAIGIFGGTEGTTETGLPGNSGYAVAEYYFSDLSLGGTNTVGQSGYKFVAEFEKYESGTQRMVLNIDQAKSEKYVHIPGQSDMAITSGKKLSNDFISAFKDAGNGGKWKYAAIPAELQ